MKIMSTDNKTRVVTTYRLQEMKSRGEKIAMLTAYDYSMARIVDSAGVDVVLVGDSAANVMAGYETTVPMSRPSITTPRRRPISCCMATSLRRTAGMALTWLTQLLTSIVRILPSARSPFT